MGGQQFLLGAKRIEIEGRVVQQIELDAAAEEVATLDRMAEGVEQKIKSLRSERSGPALSNPVAAAVRSARGDLLKGYEELSHNVYGRSVLGRITDTDGNLKRAFVYRITQANVSYIDQGCYVLARNAPRASQLITARPGDEVEVITRGEEEYLEIDQVRTFDGATGLLRPGKKPDFRMMSLRQRNEERPVFVENLRATVSMILAPQEDHIVAQPKLAPGAEAVPAIEKAIDLDPTWLGTWKGVYLASSDTQSLGHEFFTRTTSAQEVALTAPRGLTFVEGIAGAGKTSVALGRLKFFANFATGSHLEDYGLQNAPLADFSPSGMVGFVLSHSLKRYLRDTATALDLERLPVKDFDEFRKGLATEYGLTKSFRNSKAAAHPLRTRMVWIRALDAAIALSAAEYLRKRLADFQDLEAGIRSSVAQFADELAKSKPAKGGLNVHRLAVRLEKAVEKGMMTERERKLGEQDEAIRLRFASDPAERQRRLERLHASFEKKTEFAVARKLLAGLRVQDLYLAAVARPEFPAFVLAALGTDKTSIDGEFGSVDEAVASLKSHLSETYEDGRPSLTDGDLVGVIGLAGLIADGFEITTRQAAGFEHLYNMRSCTGVFIDEVQDFNEAQVFLMGLSVTDTYSQVTISGDLSQQLHEGGATKFAHLFPHVPQQQINKPVFLGVNFRQRDPLARFTVSLRAVLLGDKRVSVEETPAAALHIFTAREHLARKIVMRIKKVDERATIAIICASKVDARAWFDLLEADLSMEHRSPLISERESLTRRFDVHFTDALEAKGLEFDVVIVPDLAAFALDCAIGRNQLYVATSRAKHSLFVGCDGAAINRPEVRVITDAGLMRLVST